MSNQEKGHYSQETHLHTCIYFDSVCCMSTKRHVYDFMHQYRLEKHPVVINYLIIVIIFAYISFHLVEEGIISYDSIRQEQKM